MKSNHSQTQIKRIIRAYERSGFAVTITVRPDGALEFRPIIKVQDIKPGSSKPLF